MAKYPSLEKYIEATDFVDCHDPNIILLANKLKKSQKTEIEQTRTIFEFVRDEIDHSFDINAKTVTISASEVLAEGHGICYSKSNLLAALLRASGIPGGFCYQKLLFEEGSDQMCIHSLNSIYIESLDKWIRVDARGNKSGVDAQFNLFTEKLAFEVRKDLGEADYLEIHAEPLPSIIRSLKISASTTELKANLPTDLS